MGAARRERALEWGLPRFNPHGVADPGPRGFPRNLLCGSQPGAGPGQLEEVTEQVHQDTWLPHSHHRSDLTLAAQAQLLSLARSHLAQNVSPASLPSAWLQVPLIVGHSADAAGPSAWHGGSMFCV